jgi:ribosome-binding protein aMBF1 (putative translation factor)
MLRQAFEKAGEDLAERCQQESATINRYAAERMWRSRDGQTIVARLLTITPTEVTVNFKGQATVISRELFSTGSERLLKKVEDAARTIKAAVDEAETQQTES